MTDVSEGSPAGRRVRVYIGERDHHGAQPLFMAIVTAARNGGLGGATVFRGIEGFGSHSVVHAASVIDMSGDLPIVVELVDSASRIEAFLPTLNELVPDGMITLEDVAIIRRGPEKPRA